MTKLNNSLFLTESELLDDENYTPGLLYHGNILLEIHSTVHTILSLWKSSDTLTPPTWVIEASVANNEVWFAEYLRTWWYPVWKDILPDRELSIEQYLLGKYITLDYQFSETSERESLVSWITELDNLLSVYSWSEQEWTHLSWEAITHIHNILVRIATHIATDSIQFRVSVSLKRSVNLLFLIKYEKDIASYLEKQDAGAREEFYKKYTILLKDLYNLELARVEDRTLPYPEANEDLPEEIQKIIDTVKI